MSLSSSQDWSWSKMNSFFSVFICRRRNGIWNTCGGVEGWGGRLNKRSSVFTSDSWLRSVKGFGLRGQLLTSFHFFAFVPKFRGKVGVCVCVCVCVCVHGEGGALLAVKLAMFILGLRFTECLLWGMTLQNRGPRLDQSRWDEFERKGNQGYLLTLCSMEHHKAVTFATLGRRSELPQLVGLSSLWHLGVSKRAWGAGCFHHHLT